MRTSSFRLIFAIFFLLLIGTQPVTVKGQSESPLPNLEVILLIDESGSMVVTDPENRRIDAVELFINTLGVDLSGADFRLALIAFNNDAKVIGDGFVSLKTSDARTQLLQQYREQRGFTAGNTNVLAGLQQARALLDNHQPGYKPIVVVISDGQPETEEANVNSPEKLRLYNEELRNYAANEFDDVRYEGQQCASQGITGTPIYTIAIRSAALATEASYPKELKDLWLELTSLSNGSYAENIGGNNTQFQQNLQIIFTQFLRDWLCVQVDSSTFEPLPSTKTFFVNDSHAQLIFSIAKTDPNVQVKIQNAAGKEVLSTADGVNRHQSGLSESWAILRPPDRQEWSGEWTIQLTGPGEVSFIPIYVTDLIRLNLISPPVGVLPLGGDLLIQAEVLDNNGQPVSPAFILESNVTVIGPNKQRLPGSALSFLQDSRILSVIPAPTEEGRYEININALIENQSGENIPVKQTKFIELSRLLPRLEVTSPTIAGKYPLGALTEIEAVLMLNTQEFDGAVNQSQVTAKLYQLLGNIKQEVGQLPLALTPERGGPGHYWAPLPNDLPSGDYQLDLQLVSQPVGGQKYEAPPVMIPFTIQGTATATPLSQPVEATATVAIPIPTITPIPTPSEPLLLDFGPQAFIGAGTLILLVVLGLIFFLFLGNRPSLAMMGVEDISSYSNPNNDVLFNSSDIRSYFARTHTIRDQDGNELAKLRFRPDENGPTAEVEWMAEGAQLHFRNLVYNEGDDFYPENGDIIEISDQINNVRLRVDVPERDDDYDDQDHIATV